MIRSVNGIIASQIVQYDADALAFFNRVTTAGGTLSTTEKNAVNQLVLDLKSYGIWSSMKAIYPMVGASAAACAQNLKSSSFTGTFTSGWTFASTGVTPNGTSAYMDTNFIPSSNLNLSNGHISVYNRTNIEEAKCDLGTTNGIFGSIDEILLMTRYTSLGAVFVYTQYGGAITNTNSQGFYITNRNSATITNGFKNNSKIYNVAQTAANLPNLTFYLGAQNATVPVRYATKQYAFASIGDGLTDTQASNFYTAVQAFQTTLSRNV